MSINRRLSSQITRVLSQTPIKPDHVTTLALLTGVVAACFVAQGTRSGLLLGALCLHISFLLDNCDGELARLKSCQTKFGRRYDILADLLVDCAMWMGLAMGAHVAVGGWVWYGWAALACVGSMLNESLVIWERKKGCSTSIHVDSRTRNKRKHNVFLRVLDFLIHNGDVIFLVWAMAIFGSQSLLLIVGCVFIHGIWVIRLSSNAKALLS